jgi:hypothetical protein
MTGSDDEAGGVPHSFGLGGLHLKVGLAALVVFIGTGAWMHFRYDHLRGMTDATRLLFRSTHIYLLFAALLNLAIGLRVQAVRNGWWRTAQLGGSALLILAPVLFLAGFLSEPWLGELQRPWSGPGIYASLAGVLLHATARIVTRNTADG